MLTHRTNLLLSDEEFDLISQEAIKQQTSIGEVIRRAIKKVYGGPNNFAGDQKQIDPFTAFRQSVKKMHHPPTRKGSIAKEMEHL